MEPALRRSKREHHPPTANAAVSSFPSAFASGPSNASRRSQRRRVPLGASISTPGRGTVTLPASSDVVTDADGTRRRLRAVAHTTSVFPSVTPSRLHSPYYEKKVLGRYSSHDCVLLCQTILSQLKSQTLAPTVLEETKSPASIRWNQVAKEMETTHSLRITPRECQVVWKFLAYGQITKLEAGEELDSDSDSDEVKQSPKQINTRLASESRAKVTEKKQEEMQGANHSENQPGKGQDGESGENGLISDEAQMEAKDKEQKNTSEAQEHNVDAGIKLYPTYDLPTGTPDAWYRPFGPRDALPLAFVASRFLRRKPTPASVGSSQSGQSTTLPEAKATGVPDLKRKEAELPSTNTPDVAKKLKLDTSLVSTPLLSTGPSPGRTRARSELDYFELCLRKDHEKKTPGTKFELSTVEIQRQFQETSPEIRRRCQELASQDLERLNREIVRERILQKATGAGALNSNSTLSQSSTTKPETTASEAKEPDKTGSAGTGVLSSTKTLSPAAALLAHVAAVTEAVAKSKSSLSPQNASIVANNAQVPTDDGRHEP